MLWFIAILLFVGIIAGAIARVLVPGPDPMTFVGTWALGVGGSFVGGLLGAVLFGFDLDDGLIQLAGFFGSIAGAVVILLVRRALGRNQQPA